MDWDQHHLKLSSMCAVLARQVSAILLIGHWACCHVLASALSSNALHSHTGMCQVAGYPCQYVDMSVPGQTVPSGHYENFTWCKQCKSAKPPQAHHCRYCRLVPPHSLFTAPSLLKACYLGMCQGSAITATAVVSILCGTFCSSETG